MTDSLTGKYLIDPQTKQRCRVTGYDLHTDHWIVTPITLAEIKSVMPCKKGTVTKYEGHIGPFKAHSDWINQNVII